MAYLNENYLKLKAGYLFPEIGRHVANFNVENPEAACPSVQERSVHLLTRTKRNNG